ncbi:glycosyltransferase [Candidatus Dojkabacteria bacterium]|nr:glycosyltransferase [Candidatus Dojkabacteria bacterium]
MSVKTKVSIIIPVYDAYEYLMKCVNSVICNTPAELYELILIDDKSPDSRVKKYLGSLSHPNVKVYFNKKNLGFVGNCNRGMTLTKNDVVLLNSDTEVTKGWLQNLIITAYKSDSIATVTPMSNNASILSLPNKNTNNELPKDFEIEDMSDIAKKSSSNEILSIPTAIGFCMYIKRQVITEVGLFDEETFGKGYGEENDFSMRAIKAGYINVADTKTFIYHKGNVSFQTGKSFSEEKMRKLLDKHPDFQKHINKYIKLDPLDAQTTIASFLCKKLKLNRKSQNVLFVKHVEESIGGTQVHIQHLIDGNKTINFITLSIRNDHIFVDIFSEGKLILNTSLVNETNEANEIFQEKVITSICRFFNIGLIHFHHLLNANINLLGIHKKLGIKAVFTAHDVLLISSAEQLIEHTKKGFLSKVNDSSFKSHIENLISKLNLIIYPSEYLYKKYNEVLNINTKQIVIEHGIKLLKSNKNLEHEKKKLSIAYIGPCSFQKGLKTFVNLIADTKLRNRFSWHLIGIVDPEVKRYLRQKGLKRGIHYTSDSYSNSDPSKLIEKYKVDISIFPTKVPESFCFTLSESVSLGIPAIGRNIGAIGSRIKKHKFGLTFETDKNLKRLLLDIDKDRKMLRQIYKNLDSTKITSLEEMIEKYKEVYNKIYTRFLGVSKIINNDFTLLQESLYKDVKGHSIQKRNLERLRYKVLDKVLGVVEKIKPAHSFIRTGVQIIRNLRRW